MTRQSSFKKIVRSRMEKTGESYTAARASLLSAPETDRGLLATSDEQIRHRTGRGWEEWFDALDEWGAADLSHRDIARRLAEEQGAHPLAWNVQAVVASYERVRGGRRVGEHEDGFRATASRTVAVPVERLYDTFVDGSHHELRERTATRPKSARFDHEDGSRVHVTFAAKGPDRSTVAVSHQRLAGPEEAERMKAHWRERLGEMKESLEG